MILIKYAIFVFIARLCKWNTLTADIVHTLHGNFIGLFASDSLRKLFSYGAANGYIELNCSHKQRSYLFDRIFVLHKGFLSQFLYYWKRHFLWYYHFDLRRNASKAFNQKKANEIRFLHLDSVGFLLNNPFLASKWMMKVIFRIFERFSLFEKLQAKFHWKSLAKSSS